MFFFSTEGTPNHIDRYSGENKQSFSPTKNLQRLLAFSSSYIPQIRSHYSHLFFETWYLKSDIISAHFMSN